MSSTTNAPAPPAPRPTRIATALFVVSVLFFLLAGSAIVIGQIAILAAGDATAARHWADALGPYAFGGASVAGLLSFALSYRRGGGDAADGGGGEADD
ncbi:hypothetical protein ABT337_08160 [Saccharopolyspora hirsuta]|uniref:Uncharacterized protein n=1 Tax=Saccharopolyspora hirsuta TaxID=1837 RepID=A0A5M7C6B5_SACHI|nr:hypothetical protein [Saccharopolyspora hirsuta]KAA5835211.1 hypothetical protein F1721_10520 [Saccharopolyspora hirsuta]